MTEPQNALDALHQQLTQGRRQAELRYFRAPTTAPVDDAEERTAA